jgi:hypothetical protein
MLKLKFNREKISFDFDDTLSTKKGQEMAKAKMSQGYTVYIVTARQQTDSAEVLKVADELGIPKSQIYFTNGADKWKLISKLGISEHYDNNKEQVDKINQNTQAKGILFK